MPAPRVTRPSCAMPVRQGGRSGNMSTRNASFPNTLTGIIDENGQRFATWAYDTQGRAVSSQHAGGADLTTLTYNIDGSTSVTDANGNMHSYSFTTQFGLVKPVTVTGAPVQTAGGQAFTYDSNGVLASRTDWDGNFTTYTHDASGNETSRVMALRHAASPHHNDHLGCDVQPAGDDHRRKPGVLLRLRRQWQLAVEDTHFARPDGHLVPLLQCRRSGADSKRPARKRDHLRL
jgi:YD repeat-containing protein